MATNGHYSVCHECGKHFMTVYQCGWGWTLAAGNRVYKFCSYNCRERFRKRRGPTKTEMRERARIERELRGIT